MSAIPVRFAVTTAAFAAALALGCSQPPAVSPSAVSAGAVAEVKAQAATGLYILEFLVHGVVVTSAPAGNELVLRAHVTDVAGVSVSAGSVAFQVCSHGGRSFFQMDPVPYSDCDSGQASWINTGPSHKVDAGLCPGLGTGYVCINFGLVQNPRTAGFRFKYTSQGSSVASGQSQPANFTWQ